MPLLIIHGHFYQPPRENPWTGIVDEQPTASPFHDWNARVNAECYRPNAAVHLDDKQAVVNNYTHISFNFGPTLLSWLEENDRETYERIIAADRESADRRHGHGNAIAQAYGHAILSLCNEKDLRTQIRWGLADFRHRFKREAEAIWLPETACNDRVIDELINQGMRFVILAPHQAAHVRRNYRTRESDQVNEWRPVNEHTIDTSNPYRCFHRDGSGRSIAIFFYEGAASRAIAFEKLLQSSRELVDAFVRAANGRPLLNVATDGETYGHHFKFGDLCLAHALTAEAPGRGFEVTNYGAYLENNPPEFEVKINSGPNNEGTSWSCQHGAGRWLRDCGCSTGGEADWNQSWRQPLRAALDYLRDENTARFEATRDDLFIDPWQARDDSIELILNQRDSREKFLFDNAGRWLAADEQSRALTYLELQRMLLLMYASCGWFFNDISGIETLQILRYAARALDLMEQLGLPPARDCFLEMLAQARSNRVELGTGADIFRQRVEPSKHDKVFPAPIGT